MPTPLKPEDHTSPEMPTDVAGLVNLLIEGVKLGMFVRDAETATGRGRHPASAFTAADLHELDQICHHLGVASGTPSWYWFEMVMPRPKITERETP